VRARIRRGLLHDLTSIIFNFYGLWLLACPVVATVPGMLSGDEKVIRSGRLRLWTERFGDVGDPTVLLIMGTSTQGIGWPEELVQILMDSGRQVIRFDHRDTGRSDCVDFSTDPYALADMAADSAAVLDGHGVADAHIVGTSLGAAIGQWLAVHRSSRVRTLTTMASSPMGHNPGPAWARAMTGQPAVARRATATDRPVREPPDGLSARTPHPAPRRRST
jgi:pimeloyl-ACP methyl ester carboxylesterase